MSHPFTIFAVDDVESARRVLQGAFEVDYGFESFESAEACFERLQTMVPDLLLLDVELPGINGYALCRKIKNEPALAKIQVIFISALDDLESRLHGYDSGGIDFIVKPYKLEELKHKVELALAKVASETAMQQQVAETETLTSMILSNLDEYALLIRFLRALNGCSTYRDVADALFAMLAGFELEGALQLRAEGVDLTLGAKGENTPLEVSVIQHVRTMGSVFEFKSRAAFNFPLITVLVNNMPVHDPDLCGRLRDHLAIAAESAEAKLDALQTREDKRRAKDGIEHVVQSVAEVVAGFSQKYDRARMKGSELTEAMLGELIGAIAHLGMNDLQEESILGIVRARAFDLVELYDFGDETQEALNGLAKELSAVLK